MREVSVTPGGSEFVVNITMLPLGHWAVGFNITMLPLGHWAAGSRRWVQALNLLYVGYTVSFAVFLI